MASNYTGNATAVQAPATAPAVNNPVVIVIPAGTDVRTIESITQALKVSADNHTFELQVLGGTRTAKSFAVDGTGGNTIITPNGTVGVTGAAASAGTSSAVSRGVLYADLVPLAMGQLIANTGPTFNWSVNCSATAKTGTGVYTVTLATALPSTSHAMALVSVVTDGTTGYATCGFTGTTTLQIQVFTPAAAAHDGGVINFAVYSMLT